MNYLSRYIMLHLLVLGLIPKGFPQDPPEPPLPEVCEEAPPEPAQPDLRGLNLEDILSNGIFQINEQIRKTSTRPLEATFVFGNVGNGKSFVSKLLAGDFEKLHIGVTIENSTIFFRDDDSNDEKDSLLWTTLIPEYYEAKMNDSLLSAYWDCPGFGFNTGSNAEVAQTYFLRHALEMTETAKFIFTINESSLLVYEDLQNLTDYAIILLWDVAKFDGSIGLVVTDVETRSDQPNEEILTSIRENLQLFVTAQKNEMVGEPSENEQILQRIAFVESILEVVEGEEGGKYSRLNFLRKPITCGPLLEILADWDTEENLNMLQFRALQHCVISPDDFLFALRNTTLLDMEQVLQEDSINYTQNAIILARDITTKLNNTLQNNNGNTSMLDIYTGFHDAFERNFGRIIEKGRGLQPPIPANLNPIISNVDLFMICNSQGLRTIQFFQDILSDGNEETSTPDWVVPLQIIGSGLYNLATYYIFCNSTHNGLKEYSNQIILKDLQWKREVTEVTKDIVLDFLENIPIDMPENIRDIWDSLGNDEKQFLVEIVRKQISEYKIICGPSCTDLELENPISLDCPTVNFFGKNLFLSDIINRIRLNASCYKVQNSLSRVSVVAVEKVYIDLAFQNLNPPHHRNRTNGSMPTFFYVSVIAPVWEVIPNMAGVSEISLTLSMDVEISDNHKNSSGWNTYPGGGFFGVYSEIYNNDLLTIRANGQDSRYRRGGQVGTIHLIGVNKSVTVKTETVPGKGVPDGSLVPRKTFKPVEGVVDYYKAVIHGMLSDCYTSYSSDFFFQIREHPEFAEVYTPLVFATELETLEKNYLNWRKGNKDPNCEKVMQSRLSKYYEKSIPITANRIKGANPTEKLAFTIIGSLLRGKFISQKRLDKTLNVINTENYLTALAEDIKLISKLEIKDAVDREKTRFTDSLDEKVNEAKNLISDNVFPAVESAKEALKGLNHKLLETLKAFLDAHNEAQAEAERMKDSIEGGRWLKLGWSGLSAIGTVVSFFGPHAALAGAGIKAIASVGGALTGKEQDLNTLPKSFSQYMPDESDQHYLDLLEGTSGRSSRSNNTSDKTKTANVVRGNTLIQELGSTAAKAIIEWKKDDAQIDQLNTYIEDSKKTALKMQNQIDTFNTTFVKNFDRISDNVLETSKNLGGTSKAGLIVKKWELKKTMKNMRKVLEGFTGWISDAQKDLQKQGKPMIGEFGVYEKSQACFDTLDEALVVLVEMYTNIEALEERKEFAQFTANLHNPSTGIDNLVDPDLRAVLRRFELAIRTNLLLQEYKIAEHAFKQFIFPFAADYLMKNNDVFGLKPDSSITLVVDTCQKQINNFRSIIQKNKALTIRDDEYVFHANFTSSLRSTRPFFVWRNEKWEGTISQLLKGNVIRLKADCNMSGHENEEFFADKGAIKFKKINIYVKATNESRQEELTEVLKDFQMHMTHSGMSIYKVQQNQYVMRDAKQTLTYNFESHAAENVIRYKVTGPDSDFLMSPYTWWTLQIRDIAGNGFDSLKTFEQEVDLELEGSGLYLDETIAGTKVLNGLKVSDFYESYESEEVVQVVQPCRCDKTQLSNIRFVSEFDIKVDNSSDQARRLQFDDGYYKFAKDSNANSWQDVLNDYQERSNARPSYRQVKRPRQTHRYFATPEYEEPQANAEAAEDDFPDFEPKPRRVSENEEEEEEMQEEYDIREEEGEVKDSNSNFAYPG